MSEIVKHKNQIEQLLYSPLRVSHFSHVPEKIILLLVSEAYNIAAGWGNLSEKERKELAPHRNLLLKLAYCQSTVAEKVALLNQNRPKSIKALRQLHALVIKRL